MFFVRGYHLGIDVFVRSFSIFLIFAQILKFFRSSMVDFDVREDGRGVQLLRAKSHVSIPSILERRKLVFFLYSFNTIQIYF